MIFVILTLMMVIGGYVYDWIKTDPPDIALILMAIICAVIMCLFRCIIEWNEAKK